jgi:hypothetical protein
VVGCPTLRCSKWYCRTSVADLLPSVSLFVQCSARQIGTSRGHVWRRRGWARVLVVRRGVRAYRGVVYSGHWLLTGVARGVACFMARIERRLASSMRCNLPRTFVTGERETRPIKPSLLGLPHVPVLNDTCHWRYVLETPCPPKLANIRSLRERPRGRYVRRGSKLQRCVLREDAGAPYGWSLSKDASFRKVSYSLRSVSYSGRNFTFVW